ncbi:MAG: hypothetical protein E7270_01540 [Lachnospiraceae bacterium]|nr:hypothetical protein [Lachnospiraceae bacterium]
MPALILEEVDQEAFSIYEAIIVLVQNYSLMFNDEQYLELISNLSKLVLMKNSLSTLLLQCESLIIQQQGVINNSATPYKLSHRFLTSLLKDESSC